MKGACVARLPSGAAWANSISLDAVATAAFNASNTRVVTALEWCVSQSDPLLAVRVGFHTQKKGRRRDVREVVADSRERTFAFATDGTPSLALEARRLHTYKHASLKHPEIANKREKGLDRVLWRGVGWRQATACGDLD